MQGRLDKPINHGNLKILNLGCGYDFYGTDRVDMKKTSATTLVLDINEDNLPFPDEYFDEVRFWKTFEHVKNCGLVMEEVYRVLKKGGKIDVTTDNAGYIIFHVKSEHNSYLTSNPFYHRHQEDFHRQLFVPSHLKVHLWKFKNLEWNYDFNHISKNWWKKIIIYLTPFHLLYEFIHITGVK